MTKSTSAPDAALARRRLAAVPMLAGLGVLVGTWALLPRYGGPRLELGPRGDQLEFVDHVVPGTLVIVVSLLALLIGRRATTMGPLFGVGLVILVAGLWMDATHLPLVLQATRGEAPWGRRCTTARQGWQCCCSVSAGACSSGLAPPRPAASGPSPSSRASAGRGSPGPEDPMPLLGATDRRCFEALHLR